MWIDFAGPRGDETLLFVPDGQEDLVRALSAYLPHGTPTPPNSS